jgi:hypothetical protein
MIAEQEGVTMDSSMYTIKDEDGNAYDLRDSRVRLARLLGDPRSVHLLIERLPDPRAVELLKLWSQVILDTEEREQQVLWFVQAPRGALNPLQPGRAGVDAMLKRWKAENERVGWKAPEAPEETATEGDKYWDF